MRDYRPDYRYEDKPPVWVQIVMMVLCGAAFYGFLVYMFTD